jgi:hypothetical protein
VQKFKYYLHDNYTAHEMREFLEDGLELSEEAWQRLTESRPFYEVTLTCTVDDNGDNFRIISAE